MFLVCLCLIWKYRWYWQILYMLVNNILPHFFEFWFSGHCKWASWKVFCCRNCQGEDLSAISWRGSLCMSGQTVLRKNPWYTLVAMLKPFDFLLADFSSIIFTLCYYWLNRLMLSATKQDQTQKILFKWK